LNFVVVLTVEYEKCYPDINRKIPLTIDP